MQMAQGGSSMLDNLLEIADSVTPTQNVFSIDFTFDIAEGMYIIVSNPPGTEEYAAQQSQNQTLNMMMFTITGKSTKIIRLSQTVMYKKNNDANNQADWWTPTITIGATGVNCMLMPGDRYYFQSGVTYYLLRVKGM